MAGSLESQTRATLLLRLRDRADQAAWKEFLDRYVPKIYGWCRRYRLQEADAADVTQEVLGKLVRGLQSFTYDPARGSFRGWLKTITANAVRDLTASWTRTGRGTGTPAGATELQALQAPDAVAALVEALEQEAQLELLRAAEARVEARVQPHTWRAYRLTALEQQPAAAVAQELGMPLAEVYVAKSRVLRLLRQEVDLLNTSPQSRQEP
jgi:RNA polymerase sigma-70 factor (ECF subfamily)